MVFDKVEKKSFTDRTGHLRLFLIETKIFLKFSSILLLSDSLLNRKSNDSKYAMFVLP